GPVFVVEALIVTPHAAEHRGPRVLDDEEPPSARADVVAFLIPDVRRGARDGYLAGPGFGLGHAGQLGDHDRPGLRLPPGVDHRHLVAADDAAVPHPRLRVDRFADAAEQLQGGQVVLRRDVLAPLHHRAYR